MANLKKKLMPKLVTLLLSNSLLRVSAKTCSSMITWSRPNKTWLFVRCSQWIEMDELRTNMPRRHFLARQWPTVQCNCMTTRGKVFLLCWTGCPCSCWSSSPDKKSTLQQQGDSNSDPEPDIVWIAVVVQAPFVFWIPDGPCRQITPLLLCFQRPKG